MEIKPFIHQMIEPKHESLSSRLYDWIMLLAIVIGILPLMFKAQPEIFWYFDVISCACFLIDYLLRWITADMNSKHHRVVAFLIYPFTPMAIIDLLSILPTFNIIGHTFKIARISRMLKILRVIKFVRYFEPLILITTVVHRQSKILWTVFSLALFYTFVTALIMFNAEEEIDPETGRLLFEDFFDAFYWAVCTLTTVGYGDIYPISDLGRVISIISSMVGIAIIALPSGIVTAGYMEELKRKREYEEQE